MNVFGKAGLCSLWLVLAAAEIADAQPAKDYPPGWPRPGATLLVENDRGAAYNVEYPKDQPTPLHRHRYFFAGLDLNTATITQGTGSGGAVGPAETASISSTGNSNHATISQQGNFAGSATINTTGNNNNAAITQDTNPNTASITQSGDSHSATISQVPFTSGNATFFTFATAAVNQSGTGATATIDQVGSFQSTASINQTASLGANQATVNQGGGGLGKAASITQNSTFGDNATVNQTGGEQSATHAGGSWAQRPFTGQSAGYHPLNDQTISIETTPPAIARGAMRSRPAQLLTMK